MTPLVEALLMAADYARNVRNVGDRHAVTDAIGDQHTLWARAVNAVIDVWWSPGFKRDDANYADAALEAAAREMERK